MFCSLSFFSLRDHNGVVRFLFHSKQKEKKTPTQRHTKYWGNTMRCISITPLLAFALIAISSAQETCPEIPANDVEMGKPVPMVPGDIPKGCSAFEIIVGQFVAQYLLSLF
jgi:hypothetical protein